VAGKSNYALNKLGYGLHLPNLPKGDYLKLKQRCADWNMSMVQVILMGLRALDYLSEDKVSQLAEKAVADV
jgi:hypothetical protein